MGTSAGVAATSIITSVPLLTSPGASPAPASFFHCDAHTALRSISDTRSSSFVRRTSAVHALFPPSNRRPRSSSVRFRRPRVPVVKSPAYRIKFPRNSVGGAGALLLPGIARSKNLYMKGPSSLSTNLYSATAYSPS
eukprot:30981-Pelagococcus_subviridis.AAC.6